MKTYLIRIIKGSLNDLIYLEKFNPKVIEEFNDSEWDNLLEVFLTIDEIKKVQKRMVKHYEDPTPWYMDGYEKNDKNKIIVAFGVDDGENGKIFTFDRDDKVAFQNVENYAISKGIPKEQIDFLDK